MSSPEITILIKARDEAKAVLQSATQDVKNYTSAVTEESQKASVSMKSLATSFAGLATAGFSLYSMYESVQRSQVQLHRVTNSLEDAQRRQERALAKLNAEIAEHGASSQEAAKAQEDYEATCKDVEVLQERVTLAQNNYNEALLRTATFAIPSLITFLDRGKAAMDLFKGSTDDATVSFNLFKSSVGLSIDVIGGFAIIAAGNYAAWELHQQKVNSLTKEQRKLYDELSKKGTSDLAELAEAYIKLTDAQKNFTDGVKDQTTAWYDVASEMFAAYAEGMKQLTEYADKLKDEMDMLKESYFDVFTEESEEFQEDVKEMAKAVDSALSGMQPNFALTQRLIEEFARRWGISWKEAERIIMDVIERIKKENKELVEDTEDTVTKINIAWKGLGIPTRVKRERKKKRAGEEEEEPLYMEHVKRHRKEKEAAGFALPGFYLPISESGYGGAGGGYEAGGGGAAQPPSYYKVSEPTVGVVGERGVEYISRAPPVTVQPQVYITAAPQVNVNIYGQMQPAMVSIVSTELKKASYEGISEALRDELRRLGKRIYTG